MWQHASIAEKLFRLGRTFVPLPAKLLSAKKKYAAETAGNILSAEETRFFALMRAEKNTTQENAVQCVIRAPSPQACGYKDWETVRKVAEEYPHLRPCPKKNWWWIERTNCLTCDYKKGDTE